MVTAPVIIPFWPLSLQTTLVLLASHACVAGDERRPSEPKIPTSWPFPSKTGCPDTGQTMGGAYGWYSSTAQSTSPPTSLGGPKIQNPTPKPLHDVPPEKWGTPTEVRCGAASSHSRDQHGLQGGKTPALKPDLVGIDGVSPKPQRAGRKNFRLHRVVA